jgi:hypothetical protein
MTRPIPKPVTNMKRAACNVDVDGDRCDSKKRPTVMMPVPAMGKTRYRPVCDTI